MDAPEGKHPITVDELKPFFRPEAAVELELALTRYHLAVAHQQLAGRDEPGDNGVSADVVTLTDDIRSA